MVQSCHTTLIDELDFQNMQKNAYPIALCFNGKDHFTPTKPSSESKFYSWKLNKELGPIVSASLLVIEELDKHKLAPAVLTAINQLEDTICQTLPVFSPTSLSSHLKAVAAQNKAGPLHRGPVLQPGGEQVSSSDAQPALDPASTSANPLSLPDADQPEAPEEPQVRRRRGPKKLSHLWSCKAKKTWPYRTPVVCSPARRPHSLWQTPMYWPKFQYQSISEKTHWKPA